MNQAQRRLCKIKPCEKTAQQEDDFVTITLEIDEELLRKFTVVVESKGLTVDEVLRQFLIWLVDPATKDNAQQYILDWLRDGG